MLVQTAIPGSTLETFPKITQIHDAFPFLRFSLRIAKGTCEAQVG